MQSQKANIGSEDGVNHPRAAEWMEYLYDETAPGRKRELQEHLAQCGDCGRQLQRWRSGLAALDEWRLPARPRPQPRWQPATTLKWAAAAAVVLAVGFAIGRQTSSTTREVAALKASVAHLSGRMQSARGFIGTNTLEFESATANQETFRWLSEYAQANEEIRAEDHRTVALALREMDSRLIKLRNELETVAVNTAAGFRQTKAGLTTLATYTVPDRDDAPDFPKPENKKQ
jgi:hypothetical protein